MSVRGKTRVLLTGASGFLGFNLMSLLKTEFELYGTYCANAPPIEPDRLIRLDVTSPENVKEVLEAVEPEVVVHAAAKADVDFCEKNHDVSFRVNVRGSENLVRQAELVGARFIYFSTDLVFDGEKGNYSEEDDPKPTSFYGTTKLESEKRVLEVSDKLSILRLSCMYGSKGHSNIGFVYKLVEYLKAGQPFRLFTDQYRTPLYVDDVAEALRRIILDVNFRGLYHLGGPERVSRWEFGQVLAEVFGFSRELLSPIKMEDLPEMMARPRDCSLNSSRLCERLNLPRLSVKKGLLQLKQVMAVNQQ
jgi:dTDP-4-dehydrorhamnose reductase